LSSFSDFVRLDVDRLVFKCEGGVISRDIKAVPLFAGIHFATINIEYLGYKISRDAVVEVKGYLWRRERLWGLVELGGCFLPP